MARKPTRETKPTKTAKASPRFRPVRSERRRAELRAEIREYDALIKEQKFWITSQQNDIAELIEERDAEISALARRFERAQKALETRWRNEAAAEAAEIEAERKRQARKLKRRKRMGALSVETVTYKNGGGIVRFDTSDAKQRMVAALMFTLAQQAPIQQFVQAIPPSPAYPGGYKTRIARYMGGMSLDEVRAFVGQFYTNHAYLAAVIVDEQDAANLPETLQQQIAAGETSVYEEREEERLIQKRDDTRREMANERKRQARREAALIEAQQIRERYRADITRAERNLASQRETLAEFMAERLAIKKRLAA